MSLRQLRFTRASVFYILIHRTCWKSSLLTFRDVEVIWGWVDLYNFTISVVKHPRYWKRGWVYHKERPWEQSYISRWTVHHQYIHRNINVICSCFNPSREFPFSSNFTEAYIFFALLSIHLRHISRLSWIYYYVVFELLQSFLFFFQGFGSRSNSLERNSCSGTLGPAQPFVADPSMPPLPIPNTAIQLEEARRRLEDDVRPRMKQR